MTDTRQLLKDQRLGNGLGDHLGLSWTVAYGPLVGRQEVYIDSKDRQILADLAKQVAQRAARPQETEKRERWIRHNRLEETEPLLFCDPELAWYELIPADQLRCSGSLARIWEFRLLKEIFWADQIQDDRVVSAEWTVQTVYRFTSRGLASKKIGGESGGAYRWEAPIKDYSQVSELQFQKIEVDQVKTKALLDLAQEVFSGILTVRADSNYWWTLGLTSDLILLRGFEQVMLDMYDDPEGLSSLMAFLRDEKMAQLDYLEENNLLSLNNGGDFVGTGGYGWSDQLPQKDFQGQVRLMDMWGFAESQETVNVSPRFFHDFVFVHQKPLLERFGLNIYGCCEPLDDRWDSVSQIPHLRRVTVSPWSNPEVMAATLAGNYVFCRKINPAFVALAEPDEESARKELKETFIATKAQGCPTEVMLRDVLTFAWQSSHPGAWVRWAREEAAKVYG